MAHRAANPLTELTLDNGEPAHTFVPDSTKPTLVSYKLDMHSQLVTMTFDETMKASTLSGTQLTFYNAVAGGASFMALTGGVPPTVDSTVLTLSLSETDFNELQKREDLATGTTDTFLSITSVVEDMNTNTVVGLAPAVAQQAKTFVADAVAATLKHWDLDLTAETLTLVFSETMDVSSFDATEITLISASAQSGATKEMALTGEVAASKQTVDATTVVLTLLKADLETIKLDLDLATGGQNGADNTYIVIENELISDQSTVAVAAVELSAAQPVRTFTADTTAPVLQQFTLDMTTGMVYLSFTETMQGGDVLVASMAIQSDGTAAPAASVQLAGTFVDVDALTVQFVLDTATLNALKKAENLATATSDTFIKLALGSAKDMAGVAVLHTARPADAFTADATAPRVVSFTIDLTTNSETLEITFDETVDKSSLLVAELSLQSEAVFVAGQTEVLPLSTATSSSADGTVIVLALKKVEVDELKRLDICMAAASCFLSLSEGAIVDMNGQPIAAIAPDQQPAGAQPAAAAVGETTKPELHSFVKFDYNAAEITLSFNEPVLPGTINPAALELHSRPNQANDADRIFRLTGGGTASARGATIVLSVTEEDMNGIKFMALLCKEGDGVDCHVRLGAAFITDAFANAMVPVENTAQASTPGAFQPDTSGPILRRFQLDMQQVCICVFVFFGFVSSAGGSMSIT